MSPKDRLLQFVENQGISKREFYLKTGLSNGYLDKGSTLNAEKIGIISTVFPDLNMQWVMHGIGSMLLSDTTEVVKERVKPVIVTVDNTGRENITLVNYTAAAGYLTGGYAQPEFVEQLPAFSMPGFTGRTYRAFEVRGESMFPTISPSDVLISSYVDNWQAIRDTYVHILVTQSEGIVVKRLINRLKDKGWFVCKSDNPAYTDYLLRPDEILEIWLVHAKITYQLPLPDRTENRLNELEMDVMDIKHKIEELEQKRLP